MGLPYTEWEKRGAFTPLVESYVKYHGRARYDDLLEMTVTVERVGRVRLKFSNTVVHVATRQPVCSGFTIHAVVSAEGKAMRIPDWVEALVPEAPDTTAP